MKKHLKNLTVTGVAVALFAVFALPACSSKKATEADNMPASAPSSSVATNETAPSANLGASSSGRGR